MNLFKSSLLVASLLLVTCASAKDYTVTSPDGHLKVTVSDGQRLTWSISRDGVVILSPSAIILKTTSVPNGEWPLRSASEAALAKAGIMAYGPKVGEGGNTGSMANVAKAGARAKAMASGTMVAAGESGNTGVMASGAKATASGTKANAGSRADANPAAGQTDSDGYDRGDYDRGDYGRGGYDRDGYGRGDYDRDGYDRGVYDRDDYDRDGLGRGDYGRDGYDRGVYDRGGYDRGDYDRDGYDRGDHDRDAGAGLQAGEALSTFGEGTRVRRAKTRAVDQTISTVAYKRAVVRDHCNEMTLDCSGDFSVIVRAYDEGCAYRLVSKSKSPLRVVSEDSEFAFDGDFQAFVPYVNDNRAGERYSYSFESYYDEHKLSQMYSDSLAITPLAVCLPDGVKAVVMETAVENYPGLFLYRNGGSPAHTLQSHCAPLPTAVEIGGYNRLNLLPVQRAGYIADIAASQALPWRIVLVTTEDTQLLDTDIPYCLAPACRIGDTSWIRPGKVAWDWWNDWNISGVDFRAGINTDTYKYYIDFASRNGLEYIIVDEGWSSEEDLLEYANDQLSIPELVAYGRERNVGVILWSSWRNLIKNMDRNMSHYAAEGVKGFKVDFFDRDDQEAVTSTYEIAEAAARHHLLVDYHGMKPTGGQRAYPNIVNFEGVKGLENCKWEQRRGDGPVHDMPRYDVSIPFLRMLPGPLDYTPGAMQNAGRANFFGNNHSPMSMGTRVHQMAMYTIYEAPLQMLADSPTHYEKNQECTSFIAAVPTTFDETVPLLGEMGEYVAIARRRGDTWYVAAMNNWTPRDLCIDLGKFLTSDMDMDCFSDGVNADNEPTDYKHITRRVSAGEKINIHLAPGGGWAAIFR